MPEDTSIDFQLCTADSQSELAGCNWDPSAGGRPKITVTAHGACSSDADCAAVAGYGTGVCTDDLCRFVSPPKIWRNAPCAVDSDCPNGPLGAGDYMIKTRCETDREAPGYRQCVGVSVPLDLGSTLAITYDGRPHAKVRITLNANLEQNASPSLFDWLLTYHCRAGL